MSRSPKTTTDFYITNEPTARFLNSGVNSTLSTTLMFVNFTGMNSTGRPMDSKGKRDDARARSVTNSMGGCWWMVVVMLLLRFAIL